MCKKLILGIPTYNRQDKCFELIKKLSSIKNIFNYVEIVVVDNSDINIGKLGTLIQKNFSLRNTTYINNKKNLGLDNSILSLINYAKKKLSKIWFISDDDELYFDKIIDFTKFINNSKSSVVLCGFQYLSNNFKININQKINFYKINKFNAYKRASFLPTVALDPKNLEVSSLKHLCGTNYIHIAVINSLISSYNQLEVYPHFVGKQSQNKVLAFSIKDTFIEGYTKCLKWRKILNEKEIKYETAKRIRGYLTAILKNIVKINKKEFSLIQVTKIGISIYKFLGLIELIKFVPIMLLLFIKAFVRVY